MFTGFANGLFGSGGGTILVPILEKVFGKDAHKSHSIAIAVILPLSVISAFLYDFPQLSAVIKISVGGMFGGFLGAKFLSKISSKKLHIIFGCFMTAGAVKMLCS